MSMNIIRLYFGTNRISIEEDILLDYWGYKIFSYFCKRIETL